MSVRQNPARLTDRDRHLIAQARELAEARGKDIRDGDDDLIAAYGGALGRAQYMLGELADLAERLAADDTGQDR
jgi:hypothetical protein